MVAVACNSTRLKRGDPTFASRGQGQTAVECPTASCRIIREVKLRSGIACSVNGVIVGPPSYLASDVGKRGVPRLRPSDFSMLRKIKRYSDSPTLRFTYVNEEFVVFDSYPGPCNLGAGIDVLNHCNEIYNNNEPPSAITFGSPSSNCRGTPRPWMPRNN